MRASIRQGQSRTIEVDLFSDAATGGPWTVAASLLGGAHAFVVTSTLGDRTYEWPGIVVE